MAGRTFITGRRFRDFLQDRLDTDYPGRFMFSDSEETKVSEYGWEPLLEIFELNAPRSRIDKIFARNKGTKIAKLYDDTAHKSDNTLRLHFWVDDEHWQSYFKHLLAEYERLVEADSRMKDFVFEEGFIEFRDLSRKKQDES